MRNLKVIAVASVFGAAMAVSSAAYADDCSSDNLDGCIGKPWVDGDVMETPLGSKWWPNELWGEGDQAGSTNWYKKSEVVLRAIAQIKQGKTLKMGHEYHADMPLFGARKFVLRIPGTPTGGPWGANSIVYNDEFLATEVGQVGTQFDGLGHIGVHLGALGDKAEMRWYNGFSALEMGSAYGLLKNGVEHLNPIIARGTLIDVAGYRGVDSMESGEVITMDDIKGALAKQGMADFVGMPGDAIVIRSGWEMYWGDPVKYNDGCPGIGMEVARWIAEDVQAGVTGFDTWPGDAVPNPDPQCAFCVHQYLQTRHGIVNQENMLLSEAVSLGVYQFAYFYSPTPIRGATGSMGAPVGIY